MKRVMKLFIILLIAIGIGFLVHKDPGYILIHYATWQIETSLWFVVIVVFLTYFLVHFLLRLHHHTSSFPGRFIQWKRSNAELQSKTLLHAGILALLQGNWKLAENAFNQITKRKAYSALMPLLGCAFAAHLQHDASARNSYLQEAVLRNPNDQMAIELCQARLQLQNGEWRPALLILKKWQAIKKDSLSLLLLLFDAYDQADDWQAIVELIPVLKKQKLLTITMINKYVNALMHLDKMAEAQKIIETTLPKQWDDNLINTYGLLTGNDTAKKINFAESLLKNQPNNAQLYLCLGRLTSQEKLLGKSKHYLEQGIQIHASSELYRELAKVYEALGNQQAALECYKRS